MSSPIYNLATSSLPPTTQTRHNSASKSKTASKPNSAFTSKPSFAPQPSYKKSSRKTHFRTNPTKNQNGSPFYFYQPTPTLPPSKTFSTPTSAPKNSSSSAKKCTSIIPT